MVNPDAEAAIPSAMTMNDPAFRSLISVFFSGRMPLRIWPS